MINDIQSTLFIEGYNYKILNQEIVKEERVKPGTIERHLFTNYPLFRPEVKRTKHNTNLPEWKVTYIKYHLTVKADDEEFTRIFVFTETEFEKLKITKSTL